MATLKLSEAILMNGMTTPQGFGPDSLRSVKAPCAIGGALQSIGKQKLGYRALLDEWDWAGTDKYNCPVKSCRTHNEWAMNIIWHLNDHHRWSRTAIAGWVATIEPAEEVSPAVEAKIAETCLM
jgi:hypothetical protein